MKRRALSVLLVLVLCLGLVPGPALAAEETGEVKIKGVTLVSGKKYVRDESADVGGLKVRELTEAEAGTAADYLEYSGNTLTVHGTVKIGNADYSGGTNMTILSDVTLGGDGSLEITEGSIKIKKDCTLTLDGSVNLTIANMHGVAIEYYPVNLSVAGGTLAATKDYTGRVDVKSANDTTVGPVVENVSLNLQNSGSIAIKGSVQTMNPRETWFLKSQGDINITNAGSAAGAALTAEADGNVLICNDRTDENFPAYGGSMNITAKGTVDISSKNGIPVASSRSSTLAVTGAQYVSVEGVAENDAALLPGSVSFQECGGVTLTNNGSGGVFMPEGGSVTTDTLVFLEDPEYFDYGIQRVILPDGEIWEYFDEERGIVTLSDLTRRACFKGFEGWGYYVPAEDGESAVLTLDGIMYGEKDFICGDRKTTVVAKGVNSLEYIESSKPVQITLAEGGKLNAIVKVTDTTTDTKSFTVYGDAVADDEEIEIDEKSSLTITPGASLTLDEDSELQIRNPENLTVNDGARIINDGNVALYTEEADFGNNISEYIQKLGLTGEGEVVTRGPDASDTITDTGFYTNEGVRRLESAGTLDFSDKTIEDKNPTAGYHWRDVVLDTEDNTKIKSGTLVLSEGFNAEKVTLPDAAVKIVAEGTCAIGELAIYGDSPQNTELTFSGKGPLTVRSLLNLSGGNNNKITVEEGANVRANGGITIGAAGVDGLVTVNGTLIANGGSGPAIYAGKVVIGEKGVLEVTGANGVILNGMDSRDDFKDLFHITGDGRFTADCGGSSISVSAPNTDVYPKGEDGNPNAKAVIALGEEFMPGDCEPRVNGTGIDLYRISANELYKGPLTIHKKHVWLEDIWASDGTTHWHPCKYEGCDKKKPGSEAAHTATGGSAATCQKKAVCGVCKQAYGDFGPHTPGTSWKSDSTHHWHVCTTQDCEAVIDSTKAAHVPSDWIVDQAATLEAPGSRHKECETCKCVLETQPISQLTPDHKHVYGTAWKSDGTNHWHECGCGDKSDLIKHSFQWQKDSGEHWQTCSVCQYATAHAAHAPAYKSDQSGHWQECVCGDKTATEAHDFGGATGTVCGTCGYRRTLSGGGSGSGGSGGGSSDRDAATCTVTVEKPEHGKVVSNRARAASGSTVTLTVTPDAGWALESLTVTDSRGENVKVTEKSGGGYTFTMPGRDVTVRASFASLACAGGAGCPSRAFSDLDPAAWYHEALDYVLEKNLMSGYAGGVFRPGASLTRAQFAQILYNQAGRPAPEGDAAFADVPADAWCAAAVAWASQSGIVSGYEDGLFRPDAPITREQLAVMLWRCAGRPAPPNLALDFTDAAAVSGYARDPMRWAVDQKLLSGYGDGRLNPQGQATRAQTAQVLKNFLTR